MTSNQLIAKRLAKLFTGLPNAYKDGKNFNTVLGAIAESDADLENLFIEVRKQLFVETAEGSYLDILGSNLGIPRPPLIGMVDADYREFIKLQSYYPKQIKQLLFRLMELFYGVDTIKASVTSLGQGPYLLIDGSTLNIQVDESTIYSVQFNASSFNNPNAVTAAEIAAQINTQISDALFATVYRDAIDKVEYVQLFTNTYGPVGSIKVIDGTANRFLKFPNTSRNGATISTIYRVEQSASTVKLYWAGGDNPQFAQLQTGDYVLLTCPNLLSGNQGSFAIDSIVDTGVPATILASTAATFQSANVVRYNMPSTAGIVVDNSVLIAGFTNSSNNGTLKVLAVTAGYIDVESPRVNATDDEAATATVDLLPSAAYIAFSNDSGVSQAAFSVTSIDDVLFFRGRRFKLESYIRPSTIWEVNGNEIVVTLPATPVVVRRNLAGSSHLQGTSAVVSRMFLTSIEVNNPEFFPLLNGRFWLQKPNGVILTSKAYNYAALNVNTLVSVTPSFVPKGNTLSLGVGPLSASIGFPTLTVASIDPHGLTSGEIVNFTNFNGFAGLQASDINGVRSVASVIDDFTFTVNASANATSTTSNAPSVNKGEIYTGRGMKVVITNVQQNTGYVGAYIYDPKNAKYTIAETQTTTTQAVQLGEFGASLSVFNSTVFPESSGELIFNYGRADEEGPVRYIAKPNLSTIFIDPSYRFLKAHDAGAAINLVRSKFGTSVSTNGKEYPVYIVDTIGPRETLKTLLLDAKAAGVSMRFIVVLPDNVYNAYSLYELD
jgi:hypothetical protein